MLTLSIGFTCDYPGCGRVETRRRAYAEPRPSENDFEPPQGWLLIQTVGKEEAQLFCADHSMKLEGGAAVLAKRVGFHIPSAPAVDHSSVADAE